MPNYDEILDSEVRAFIARTAELYSLHGDAKSFDDRRAAYNAMAASFDVPRPNGVTSRDEMVEGVSTRIYNDAGDLTVIYYHGGGFLVGNLDTHDRVCAEIADQTRRRVVAVDYRLSPEHSHPAAYEDALLVAQHWRQRGEVILTGDSAGGQLAAAVTGTMGREIRGQVLVYPALGGDITKGSYIEHANAPMLSTRDVLYYAELHGGDANDPTLNPLRGRFDQLPPTIAFGAEADPIRDDSKEYVDAINAAGGQARFVLDRGLVHGHLRARHVSKRARDSFTQIVAAISELAQG